PAADGQRGARAREKTDRPCRVSDQHDAAAAPLPHPDLGDVVEEDRFRAHGALDQIGPYPPEVAVGASQRCRGVCGPRVVANEGEERAQSSITLRVEARAAADRGQEGCLLANRRRRIDHLERRDFRAEVVPPPILGAEDEPPDGGMRAVGADHEISCDARPVAQRDDCPIGAVGDVRDGLADRISATCCAAPYSAPSRSPRRIETVRWPVSARCEASDIRASPLPSPSTCCIGLHGDARARSSSTNPSRVAASYPMPENPTTKAPPRKRAARSRTMTDHFARARLRAVARPAMPAPTMIAVRSDGAVSLVIARSPRG